MTFDFQATFIVCILLNSVPKQSSFFSLQYHDNTISIFQLYKFRIMTKAQNKKFQISLCRCKQAFSGKNLNTHLLTQKVVEELTANEDSHGKVKRVIFCVMHCAFSGSSQEDITSFLETHKECGQGIRPSKKEMLELVEGRVPDSLREKVKEYEKKKLEEVKQDLTMSDDSVDLDKSEPGKATDFLVKENKRVREEEEEGDDFPAVKLGKRLVVAEDEEKTALITRLSDSSSTSESEVFTFQPEKTPTPLSEEEVARKEKEVRKEELLKERAEERAATYRQKNAIRKQQAWSRENATEISQEKAFDNLNRRLANALSSRDKALDEKVVLEAKLQLVNRWEEQVKELKKEKMIWKSREEELEARMREMERKEKVMQGELEKARAETAKERESQRDFQEKAQIATAHKDAEICNYLKEIEKLKGQFSSSSSSSRPKKPLRLVGHSACQNGRIVKTLVRKEDLDATVECFERPEAGIACHHFFIWEEEDKSISVKMQNTRRVSIGKIFYVLNS